mmetsp:Transcript_27685/g.75467  ORF Transcript_27685/g.75467 Transcript_27685/m.75467 type:complete len:319 (-) Transcript_27685:2458-3414(-)
MGDINDIEIYLSDTLTLFVYFIVIALAWYIVERWENISNTIYGTRANSAHANSNADTNNNNTYSGTGANSAQDPGLPPQIVGWQFPPISREEDSIREEEATREASRLDLIRSRLVFQKLLSLKSKDEEKDSPSRKSHKISKGRKGARKKARKDHPISLSSDGNTDEVSKSKDNPSRKSHRASKENERKKKRHRTIPEGNSESTDPSSLATDGNTDKVRESTQDISNSRTRLRVFFHNEDISVSIKKLEKKISKMALKDQTSCSICIEQYEAGDVIVRLKSNTPGDFCNHCFHDDCIIEWLQSHDECPVCRVDMISSNV